MTEPKIEVLNFGSLNLDHVYQVPHFVRPRETLSSTGYLCNAGGKGLNQSVALARAGVKVAHAGKIGRDNGEFLVETLEKSNVDTRYVLRGDTPTGHAAIQVDSSGQNAILLYPGANCTITHEEMDSVIADQVPGTWLLLQNEINDIAYLMQTAYEHGLKIAINPAPCTGSVSDYPLELAELIFVNEVEAAQLCGSDGDAPMEELYGILEARYPQTEVVVTLGGDGAMLLKGGKRIPVPAYPANVVDTTSAGDTFSGYYLAAKLRGFPPEKALQIASRAGSITVSRSGAAESIPHASEIFG